MRSLSTRVSPDIRDEVVHFGAKDSVFPSEWSVSAGKPNLNCGCSMVLGKRRLSEVSIKPRARIES